MNDAAIDSLSRAREDRNNAFISLVDDVPAGDASEGPLAGIPFGVKDNIDTRDLATTAGTPALAASQPEADHPAVDRLTRAGAHLIGKTNLHELAFGITSNNAHFGAVLNPHDASRSAGGSSGGSGAAVATGIVPFALGTDTGGSVSVPAAWCGVTGFRPTTGRYGDGRMVPLSKTRDTVGIIADSIQRIDTLDRVLVPGAEPDAPRSPNLRLGLPSHVYLDGLGDDVDEVWRRTLDALSNAGTEFVTVDTSRVHELEADCGFDIVFAEVVRDLAAYLATLPGDPISLEELRAQIASPDVAGLMAEAVTNPRSAERYADCLRVRDELSAHLASAFAAESINAEPIDALFYPTCPITATPIGDDVTTISGGVEVPVFATVTRNTLPGSDVGLPVVSLPAGLGGRGLPVGVSVEGKRHDDRHVLSVAARVAEIIGA